MSITISLRFLAGRFHATPWDRHPNEGVPEWPPAPWRVLRAIIAAAHSVDVDVDNAELADIIGELSAPPEYTLPAATQSHIRSYQPLFASGKTTLVLDPFVAIGNGAGRESEAVRMIWRTAILTVLQRKTLARWLDALGYLGRAESWIEARVEDAEPAGESDVVLVARRPGSRSVVRLLCAADVPSLELLAGLTTDTMTMTTRRLSEPPASRWQTFAMDRAALRDAPMRVRTARPQVTPTLVRMSLAGRLTPLFRDVILFGERVRSALMSKSADVNGDRTVNPMFSGKHADGTPLQGNVHLHVLPEDRDRDGRIDHVLLWIPGGFDDNARRSVELLEYVYGGDMLLQCAAVEWASDDDTASDVAGRSTTWRSRTPFMLPRHMKMRNGVVVDGPESQLRRELSRCGLPNPIAVTPVAETDAPNTVMWNRFRLSRVGTGGGNRGSARPLGFEVTFPTSVGGPIAVGYGSRFGLGQFEPV